MEKVRPWCGQPSDRGRLRNRPTSKFSCSYLYFAVMHELSFVMIRLHSSLFAVCVLLFCICKLFCTAGVCPEPQGTPPMKKPRKNTVICCSCALKFASCMPLTFSHFLFCLLCQTECATGLWTVHQHASHQHAS